MDFLFSKTRQHLRCNLLFGLIGHFSLLQDVNISFFLSFFLSSGDTVGSIIYVPCEVIKQRMQIQGVESNWVAKNSQAGASNVTEAQYYRRFSHAAVSIVEKEGLRGLFTG